MSPLVELIRLSPDALHALAAGDLVAATRNTSLTLSPYFVDPESQSTWIRRSKQIVEDPGCADWITRVVVDAGTRLPVGRAGFHGPPDEDGMVEVGYAVDPAYQRQDYARVALEALLERAKREPDVHAVRATISPDNEASRNLVSQCGFVEVGEQWDDEDGPETIFEVRLPDEFQQPGTDHGLAIVECLEWTPLATSSDGTPSNCRTGRAVRLSRA